MCFIIVVNSTHIALFQKKIYWSNQDLEDWTLQVLKDGLSS